MAKLKPPIVPAKQVPIVPADGLKRLFAACAGWLGLKGRLSEWGQVQNYAWNSHVIADRLLSTYLSFPVWMP
jgi:hypothetical protein